MANQGVHLGAYNKLYIDDETSYASPSWKLVNNVRDVTLNSEADKAETTTRGTNGVKTYLQALRDVTVSFQMNWDPTDTNFQLLKNAHLTNIPLNAAIMDGPIATAGSEGMTGIMYVTKFSRNEPLEEATTADVEMAFAYFPWHQPAWMVV